MCLTFETSNLVALSAFVPQVFLYTDSFPDSRDETEKTERQLKGNCLHSCPVLASFDKADWFHFVAEESMCVWRFWLGVYVFSVNETVLALRPVDRDWEANQMGSPNTIATVNH